MNIISRTSAVAAVQGVFFFVELRQDGLHEGRGGADEGDKPHPEHRARPAGGDGRHDADEVSHAHPGGGGDDQGLHAGDGVLVRAPFILQRDPDHFREKAEREAPRPYGQIDSRRNQDENQQGKPQRAAAGQRDFNQIPPEQMVKKRNDIHDGKPPFSLVTPGSLVYSKTIHL